MRQPIISCLYFLAILTTCIVSIFINTSPKLVDTSAPLNLFSAGRAYRHVKKISLEPHSMGTLAHKSVRKYIITECKKLGLETEVQNTTSVRAFGDRIVAGNVYNIIARVKGQEGNKVILLMAHYDSKPNSLGAGDNAAGVAALLETARALGTGKPLKNDVILLFTDGEENRLLGANAFVTEKSLLNRIALVINLEGRGNTGSSIMFEVNSENGWIMREYAKAVAFPMANSFYYELYRILPNDTDYSVFKKAGIPGLNHAFIGGMVNYHSMTDSPKNLDILSLQHHGDNMYDLVKHFGNINLDHIKSPDISYFNVVGNWFVQYPGSWNKILTIVSALLMVIILWIGFSRKSVTGKGVFMGLVILPMLIVSSALAILLLVLTINMFYPEYKNFISGNAYNSGYYFIAITAISIAVIAQPLMWACKRFNVTSIMTGALLIITIMLFIFYHFAPSATYLIFIPLFFLQIVQLVFIVKKVSYTQHTRLYEALSLLGAFPALLLLLPMLYLMFTAFGLSILSLITTLVEGLIIVSLLPLLTSVFNYGRYLIVNFAITLCVIALLLAHLNSNFSTKLPLQTYVRYELDALTKEANWVTDGGIDFGNDKFFKNSKTLPQNSSSMLSDAPLYALQSPVMKIIQDTIVGNIRRLKLHCLSVRNAQSFSINFTPDDKIRKLIIDRKEVKLDKGIVAISNVDYYGISSKGFSLTLEKEVGPLNCWIEDQTIGLPDSKGKNVYPSSTIPSHAYRSNTTIVKQRYKL